MQGCRRTEREEENMRLIKYWDFSVGPKPPFSEWPELVHRFLDRHGLSSGAFLYHFEQEIPGDDLRKSRTREEWIASSGIRRMAKACPSFGEPRVGVNTLVLSNMDAPGSGVWQYRVRAVVDGVKTSYSNRKKVMIS